MEYQKIIHLLDNTSNQPFKFRTKNRVEIMMIQEECVTQIVKLNLRSQTYVIIVMHTYLLKEE